MSFVFNPIDPAFLHDPYPTYARLRGEHPVYRHPAGFVVVSRYADVSHVFKHADPFSSAVLARGGGTIGLGRANPVAGSLIGLDPPEHTRQRAIVSRGFTPRRIAEIEPRMRTICDQLVSQIAGRGACDLVRELAIPFPVTVITQLLGLPSERIDDFKRWSDALIRAASTVMAAGDRERFLAALSEFRAYMAQAIEARRRAPGDDLISLLISAEEEDGLLTTDQVIAFASLLVIAGAETTTNLIGNTVLALLAHPEAMERARADLSLVPGILEETLRWDSPVQLLMRSATRPVTLHGVEIAQGAFVMLAIASANRDDRQFPNADRFDPARDTAGHLAFGAGHHFCLGAALARLEGRIALEAILTRLPRLRLSGGAVEHQASFLVRGPRALPVAFG